MPTIPVGSGLAAQIVAKDELTYGVAPVLTSGVDSFEIKSETLELKKTAVQGEGLAAGHVYKRTKRRVLTNYDVTGDIAMELPTRNLGFWLRYMVGDFTQTPAQLGTSGIYKTVFQPRSNHQTHSFCVQKGVPAVDNATVEPFTYVGCKIASWTLNIATGAIGALTVVLDGRNELGGAGNGDPLNTSVPALATFATPTTGLGTGVFHFRQATIFNGGAPTMSLTAPAAATLATAPTGGTVLAGTYQVILTYVNANGETTGSTSVSIPTTGSTSTITITSPVALGNATGWYAYVTQAGGVTYTRQQAAGSPTAIGTNLVLTAPPTNTGLNPPVTNTASSGGIVSLSGATALGNVKDCTIQQATSFDVSRMFVGNSGFKAEQIENAYRALTGSLTVEWLSSEALYNAYAADTTSSLQLTFTGPTVSTSNYLLDIIIPNIKFEGETPKVPGPSVITQAVPFTGSDDEATVPLQITYQSEDSTF